jgi:hypothetical protein
VLRASARRVAVGDIDAVADLADAARELDDDALPNAVIGLRGEGYGWTEIASGLDVTHQVATNAGAVAEKPLRTNGSVITR